MSQALDVMIIGGGVIGLTSAYYLAGSGASVAVIDKGELGTEASWAGAGIIAPGRFSHSLSPIDQLRALSVAQFPALSQELQETTGIDPGYRICGGIEFFGPGDALVDSWKREGIAFEKVLPGEMIHLEPNCREPANDCFYFKEMAQIRNPRFLQALIKACRRRGVQLRPHSPVQAIRVRDRTVARVELDSGDLVYAGRYLLAAGAWTNQLLAPLHCDAGIHPVRGQIALLKTNRAIVKRIILSGKKYIVPREDGRTLIGATEEPTVGFAKETTSQGIESLLDFGFSLVPELKFAEIEKSWAGLRPGSIDGMPYLGAIPGYDNAYIASGHFRAGIQLSPGTALLMSEVLLGKKPTIPLDFFRIDRKPDPAMIPAFRS